MDSPTRYGGVDWASRSHAVCVVDGRGEAVERFAVENSEAGWRWPGVHQGCVPGRPTADVPMVVQ